MNVWELLYLPGLDESLARVEVGAAPGGGFPRAPADPKWPPTSSTPAGNASGLRLLVAAAAATGAGAGEPVVQGAVAVELVHMGSLYHDDVIDEASSAQGCPERQCPLGQPGGDPGR